MSTGAHDITQPIPVPDCTWTQPDYAHQRPWAGFLPGIAGPAGTGMWVFTVNRGQGIAAMGVGGKNQPILEFQPASRAWLDTEHTGFRTFVRTIRGCILADAEPFSPADRAASLTTDLNGLRLHTHADGLDVDVEYCTASDEPFAALVRRLTLRNTGPDEVRVQLLDGVARLIPFGIDDAGLKEIGRTLEAWMQAKPVGPDAAFFNLRASTGDAAEVTAVTAGNFAIAPGADGLLVDPTVIFGQATGLTTPDGFLGSSLDALLSGPQVTEGRTPCAFAAHRVTLAPGEARTFTFVIGHAADLDTLTAARPLLTDEWAAHQMQRARTLAAEITAPIAISTANPRFDAYARQTFLDNLMRGGLPHRLGGRVLHLYGRKHGDLERDYNAFFLPPTPLPEGNANFRDLCQNRRSDVLFHPWIGATNLLDFLGLLGVDGYNPLVLTGRRFRLDPDARDEVGALVARPEALVWPQWWAPGEALQMLRAADYGEGPSPDDLLAEALARAEVRFTSEFGEGYWVDHWMYVLDLVDTYRTVFPDRFAQLLATPVTYRATAARVPSAAERWVATDRGIRQYAQVRKETDARDDVLRDAWGVPVEVSIFSKFFGLALVKAATLDPAGIGIEMEAGKPGWYDALNGLPGLLGSSLGEVRELRRLLRMLDGAARADETLTLELPTELGQFLDDVLTVFRSRLDEPIPCAPSGPDTHARDVCRHDVVQWWALVEARDRLREHTLRGVSRGRRLLSHAELLDALDLLTRRIDLAVDAADVYATGTMYLRFEVTAYDELHTSDAEGRVHVRPAAFRAVPLPVFLEGAVHAMVDEPERAVAIHEAVTAGPLFDRELGMYRVNASLAEESHEIGRARAFSPGWLENESIWLHMEYKYLLALLRAGAFEVFHEVFARAGVHAQDPARYGRSPLENSSFIASSAHPDPSLHGAGFVARLSGATAEFASMWHLLTAGPEPFTVENGELVCRLRPALPGSWFDEDARVRFAFLGVPVTVTNPGRIDTWTAPAREVRIIVDGRTQVFPDAALRGHFAETLREGRVDGLELVY